MNRINFFCTVAFFISNFVYGQAELDNVNYQQANEIFSKIVRQNYTLGYYSGHFPMPEERLNIPIKNTVTGQYGEIFFIFLNSEIYFFADELNNSRDCIVNDKIYFKGKTN
jgi:hypothetical protein